MELPLFTVIPLSSWGWFVAC